MIEISDVTVNFGHTRALDRVNLTVGTGLVGLFGPNASGKSTLLRVIAGLLRPATGTVTIDGTRVDEMGEQQRRRLSYAGHAGGLYAGLSLAENLSLFARLYDSPRERVETTIEQLDLTRFSTTPVRALSAGLQRRAAVARALLHDPEILLLDEPYANLDEDAGNAVSRAIVSWAGRMPGRIGVIATHGAKKVRSYATAGVVLQRGRVARTPDYVGMEART